MSDKGFERQNKMSAVAYIDEAKSMADFIVHKAHRGPGDTVEAAMHRAERFYGVSANWLHRLRYRELTDMPISAFGAITNAYRAACEATERAYEAERKLADARNSRVLRLADFVAGQQDQRRD